MAVLSFLRHRGQRGVAFRFTRYSWLCLASLRGRALWPRRALGLPRLLLRELPRPPSGLLAALVVRLLALRASVSDGAAALTDGGCRL
jgi:hypothetical protein